MKQPKYMVLSKMIDDIYKVNLMYLVNNAVLFDERGILTLTIRYKKAESLYGRRLSMSKAYTSKILFDYYWYKLSLAVADNDWRGIKTIVNDYFKDCKSIDVNSKRLWAIGTSYFYSRFVTLDKLASIVINNDLMNTNTKHKINIKYMGKTRMASLMDGKGNILPLEKIDYSAYKSL